MNEDKCAFHDEKINTIEKKVDKLLDAILGTPNGTKRGFNTRLIIVESWKRWVTRVFFLMLTAFVSWAFTGFKGLK